MKIHSTLIALTFLLPGLPCLAGHIYWTDRTSGARKVRRMTLNGGSPTTTTPLISLGSADCRGIAVNVATNKIYYGIGTGIAEANLNGTGAVTRIANLSAVRDLKWHPGPPDGGFLYWCDQTGGTPPNVSGSGTIRKASAANWAVDTADWKMAPDAYYMDIDTAAPTPRIYWGDSNNTMASTLLAPTAITSDGSMGISAANIRGIAVDDAQSMVYWTERDAKAIYRCPLAANRTQLDLAARTTLYTNLDTPHGIEIDVVARKIYWVDSGTNSGVGQGDSGVSRGDMDAPYGAQEVLIGVANASYPPQTALVQQPWDLDLDLRSADYAAWVARFFPNSATTAQKASTADPDADGLNNSLEYATCTNPLRPNAAPVEVERLPSGTLRIRYRQIGNNADLTLVPQVSTDLIQWHTNLTTPGSFTAPVTTTLPGNDAVLLQTVETTNASATRIFVNLRATVAGG